MKLWTTCRKCSQAMLTVSILNAKDGMVVPPEYRVCNTCRAR